MKSIILLSGPVGAGKTTVAKELVAISPEPVSYIDGDKFWFFIAKGGTHQSRNKNFKMIMTSMVVAAIPYALYGYEVILDFSIPPWFLDTAIKLAKRRDIPLHYVVLRPSESVCAARAAVRSEGAIPDYTLYRDLYLSFDEAEQYIVKDDKSDAATVAAGIREELNEDIFRISG